MKNLLIPKKTIFEKCRFGNKRDGGYIFAKTPSINQKIYGFGVDNDITCEIELQKYFGGHVSLFDGTCDFTKSLPENFSYNKVNITKDNINSILSSDNMILKMDIEGHEFECIHNMHDDVLLNLEQIIIEFHLNYNIIDIFYNIISRLNKTHKIFHIHGNNCCGLLYNGIPAVVELSFINKKLCNLEEIDESDYPNKNLDYKNLEDRNELFFKWW